MNAMRTTFATLLAAFLAVSFVAAPARADDTELGKSMEELGKHIKAIKKNIKDPTKNEEALKLVALAQAETLKGKGLPPAMLAKAPEAEKPKIIAGYKKMMGDVLVALCKLEAQLIDGKNEDAAETLKSLKTLEDDGHEKYNP